jgi:hypothetical protein
MTHPARSREAAHWNRALLYFPDFEGTVQCLAKYHGMLRFPALLSRSRNTDVAVKPLSQSNIPMDANLKDGAVFLREKRPVSGSNP